MIDSFRASPLVETNLFLSLLVFLLEVFFVFFDDNGGVGDTCFLVGKLSCC